MKDKLLQNSYIVIDDFVTPEQANALAVQMEEVYKEYPNEFKQDVQCPDSLAIYDMWAFVELLVEKIPVIAAAVEEPMFPTYSYARMYKNGETLKRHTDRGACEVSVTLHLGNDGVEWPIYFETPDKQVAALNLKPGQAAVYLGCIAPHWRDTYEGTDYKQVFLHYVRARGENRNCYFDKKTYY
jgi:hypothetical protein